MEAHWCDQLVDIVNGDHFDALSNANGSPLLDRALGMLGFNADSVGQRTTGFLIDAITSLLAAPSSSKSSVCQCQTILGKCRDDVECICKQHVITEERVIFGSTASASFLQQVVQCCKTIVQYGQGILIMQLIEALLKACIERCLFKQKTPASFSLYVIEGEDEISTGIIHLLDAMVHHSVYHNLSSSSRLHAWRLHPMLLKQDISGVVLEAIRRPFLFSNKNFQQQLHWQKLVVCLAMFPLAFVETRRLLHNWIAYGGVWHVLSEIVDAVKRVISQPLDWGFTTETAAGLPPFHSFYPSSHRQVLRTLNGPFTSSGLDELVVMIERLGNWQELTVPWNHHDSLWSLLMDFPQWYYLALRYLFGSKATTGASAKYVTFILFPHDNKVSREMSIQKVSKAADNWQHMGSSPRTASEPKIKRLKTEKGEETLGAWLADVQGFLQEKRNGILPSIFCLGPAIADFKVLGEEAGRFLVEAMVLQARDMVQDRSLGFKEPAHRTEHYRGGGDEWISALADFFISCCSRIQDSRDGVKRLLMEIMHQAKRCDLGTEYIRSCWESLEGFD